MKCLCLDLKPLQHSALFESGGHQMEGHCWIVAQNERGSQQELMVYHKAVREASCVRLPGKASDEEGQ